MTWSIPPRVADASVHLTPLTAEMVDEDTAAYRASPVAIRSHSAGRWPEAEGFTVEENLPLIRAHEAEHRAGAAFAYAILDTATGREIGCAYLRPLEPFLHRSGSRLALPGSADDGAILTCWLIDERASRPGSTDILRLLRTWVHEWGAAPTLLRLLPQEEEQVRAAMTLGWRPVPAHDQPLPYLWFQLPVLG